MSLKKFRNIDLIILLIIAFISEILGIRILDNVNFSFAPIVLLITIIRWKKESIINIVLFPILLFLVNIKYGLIENLLFSLKYLITYIIIYFIFRFKNNVDFYKKFTKISFYMIVIYIIMFLTQILLTIIFYGITSLKEFVIGYLFQDIINLVFNLIFGLIASSQQNFIIDMNYYFTKVNKGRGIDDER